MALFEPGNPGRPPGIPNKANAELKSLILGALDKAGGMDYLAARAHDTPGPFLSLVGKVLPLQVTGKDGERLDVPHAVVFVIGAREDAASVEGPSIRVLPQGHVLRDAIAEPSDG